MVVEKWRSSFILLNVWSGCMDNEYNVTYNDHTASKNIVSCCAKTWLLKASFYWYVFNCTFSYFVHQWLIERRLLEQCCSSLLCAFSSWCPAGVTVVDRWLYLDCTLAQVKLEHEGAYRHLWYVLEEIVGSVNPFSFITFITLHHNKESVEKYHDIKSILMSPTRISKWAL